MFQNQSLRLFDMLVINFRHIWTKSTRVCICIKHNGFHPLSRHKVQKLLLKIKSRHAQTSQQST